ncbi:hypothetical protein GCM10010123_07390 [Pilimelia anulata]|uniref:Uncharacterized protein n=1 Tax=Pilimelia anulata TaxID=53371 RepID=A0A8J3B746_9ACTN|nr:hypothetical protein [Pilimelia anulata]GGJ80030.1 hypothetical protein GCM10010123_07390 [Pilimelia anulata]
MSTLTRTLIGALTGLTLLLSAAPAGAAEADDARPTAAIVAVGTPDGALTGVNGDPLGEVEKPAPGTTAVAPPPWSYYLTPSCNNFADAIRRGANWWGSASEGRGTPVTCVGGYIQGCGGDRVVGCNWGAGQRISISTRVRDLALLAAHEFGHNWHGHTGQGCNSWQNINTMMRTLTC